MIDEKVWQAHRPNFKAGIKRAGGRQMLEDKATKPANRAFLDSDQDFVRRGEAGH